MDIEDIQDAANLAIKWFIGMLSALQHQSITQAIDFNNSFRYELEIRFPLKSSLSASDVGKKNGRSLESQLDIEDI